MLPVCLKILYRYVTAPHHRRFTAELPPKGKPMKEANFNLSSLGAARHSPQKGKARREGDLRYNFTLFQGGENIGKHFVFALSAVHYDEAFFVFPRLL